MTPEQKANELVDKFMLYSVKKTEISKETMQYEFNYKIKRELAIECAIVAVDEILKSIPTVVLAQCYGSAQFENPDITYWKSVKTELEKLKN